VGVFIFQVCNPSDLYACRIEDALEAAGIRYDRLDGTMRRDDRTRAMDALKHDPGCEVLLVSLKAGGVGLNLTAAQRVYLMDPYWNPAVENQAVDRIVSCLPPSVRRCTLTPFCSTGWDRQGLSLL
jgi:hypothetical protein